MNNIRSAMRLIAKPDLTFPSSIWCIITACPEKYRALRRHALNVEKCFFACPPQSLLSVRSFAAALAISVINTPYMDIVLIGSNPLLTVLGHP